jgi:hypothetical protein
MLFLDPFHGHLFARGCHAKAPQYQDSQAALSVRIAGSRRVAVVMAEFPLASRVSAVIRAAPWAGDQAAEVSGSGVFWSASGRVSN